MAQSSVEWFYQQIRDNGAGFTHEDLMEWHRQAKAMHKEEIEIAFKTERFPCSDWDAQDYYNQTFGKKD